MVIGEKFVWGHIQKTGGTSCEKIFRIVAETEDLYLIDAAHYLPKHDNFKIKEDRLGIDLSDKVKILNIRKLPTWVLSFNNHKAWKIPFKKSNVLKGEINCLYPLDNLNVLTLEEAWKSNKVYTPDELLSHYMCYDIDYWIRTEHLGDDMVKVLKSYISLNSDQKRRIKDVFLNKRKYNSNIKHWFKNKQDMINLYEQNPIWSKIERDIYGSLLYEEIY